MKNVDLVLVMICLFSAAMIGCAEEKVDPIAGKVDPIVFVEFVAATPPSGSTIQTDESITVVFDGIPRSVVVTSGTAKTAGQTVTISGPFKAGPLKLRITWHNGGRFLNYTATAEKADLVAFVAATPPSGSAIQTDESITVVFDGTPANVAVTAGTAKTAGPTVTISGPFKAGPLNLTITWSDGAHVLNYTATAEKADLVEFVAATPPSGSAIQTDESITVVFDGTPANVAVTAGTAKTAGPTVTISGPFKAGPLKLRITWGDGNGVILIYGVAMPELGIGKPAPEFHVKDLDGGDLSLEKYRGKIILLDFWAVWCPPCRAETPHLKRTYEKFKNEGFEIIGISLDHDKAELLQYIKEEDITWPQFFNGGWHHVENDDNINLTLLYRIGWIPQGYLIDHEGVIRKSGLRVGALEPAIAELIRERNAKLNNEN